MKPQIERVAAMSQDSFICRRFEQDQFDHPYHFHPEIEVTWIGRSRGTLIVGDHIGTFEPGDLVLLGSNLPHVFRNELKPVEGAMSEVIHFSRDCADGFFDSAPELGPLADFLDRLGLGLRIPARAAPAAGPLLQSIRQSSGLKRWSQFLQLMEFLLEDREGQTLASPGFSGTVEFKGSHNMQQACQFILDHFDQDISHQDLAAQLNLSPAYFSRIFRQTTRRTYTEFLIEVRLGHACRLLTDTEQTVIDIAFASGFRNLANFNRRFRNTYACSPREFRRHHRSPR